MEINEIINIFKDKGIKATAQRIAVYKYLVENPVHPDVETVYKHMIKDNPSFSKTTVYNCLQALSNFGLITPITIDSEKIRYDADTSMHGHFKCESCGKIYDFTCKSNSSEDLNGFEVKHKNVYYSGICVHCR